MIRIEKTVTIACPPDQVFAFVSDWPKASVFYEGLVDCSCLSETERGNGTRLACSVKIPVVGTIAYEVVLGNYVEGVGWSAAPVKGPPFRESWRFEAAPGGPGQTQVTYTITYPVPILLVGPLLERLVSRPLWAERIERTLQNLKHSLEENTFKQAPTIKEATMNENTIKIESNPTEDQLNDMDVRSWPIWTKEVSEFPWSYDVTEVCYVLEGQVTVTPEGGEPVEIKPGDLVTFPKGMSCTWKVTQPIRKHYDFVD